MLCILIYFMTNRIIEVSVDDCSASYDLHKTLRPPPVFYTRKMVYAESAECTLYIHVRQWGRRVVNGRGEGEWGGGGGKGRGAHDSVSAVLYMDNNRGPFQPLSPPFLPSLPPPYFLSSKTSIHLWDNIIKTFQFFNVFFPCALQDSLGSTCVNLKSAICQTSAKYLENDK